MILRRWIRHWSAFFSLVVFCGAFDFAASSAVAAPLCSQVLVNYSAASIQSTLRRVAELKLELDLAKISGDQRDSLLIKMMKEEYPRKYQELVRALSSQHSEAKVRELITREVLKLQNREAEIKVEETAVREAQTELTTVRKVGFVFPKRVTPKQFLLGEPRRGVESVRYFPGLKGLLINGGEGFSGTRLIGTETGDFSRLLAAEISVTKVTSDDSKIFMLKKSGGITYYDMVKDTSVSIGILDSLKIDATHMFNVKIDVDPTEHFMLVQKDDSITVLDLTKNASIEKTDLPKLPSGREAKFIDADRIAFLHDGKLIVMNWRTEHTEQLVLDGLIGKFELSKDQKQLLIASRDEIAIIPLNNLKVGETKKVPHWYDMKLLPDGKHLLIEGTSAFNPTFEIYVMTDFSQPVFSFKKYREGLDRAEIWGISFSADQTSAAVFLKEALTKEVSIDIWEQD